MLGRPPHPAGAELLDDAVAAEGVTDEVLHCLWFLGLWQCKLITKFFVFHSDAGSDAGLNA